jgi:hypothetical protein
MVELILHRLGLMSNFRTKAHKQLPALRAALEANQNKRSNAVLARQPETP